MFVLVRLGYGGPYQIIDQLRQPLTELDRRQIFDGIRREPDTITAAAKNARLILAVGIDMNNRKPQPCRGIEHVGRAAAPVRTRLRPRRQARDLTG